MRKLIALLTLLVSTLGLIGAVAPTTASAANCALSNTGIFYNGARLQYTHIAQSCTDVDQVQFNAIVGNLRAGIVNTTTNPDTDHLVAIPPTLNSVLCGRVGVSYNGSCSWVGHVDLWGCGPVPQTLYSTSLVRIHRLATNTWGNWYWSTSGNQTMNC